MANSESWELAKIGHCSGNCPTGKTLSVEGPNVLGLAAQHADKYDCRVNVEITRNVEFTPE